MTVKQLSVLKILKTQVALEGWDQTLVAYKNQIIAKLYNVISFAPHYY